MGISWSSNRRNNYSQNSHPPSQLLSSSSSSSSYPYPPDPYAAPPPHPYHTHPRPPPPPPPFPMYSSYYSTGGYTALNYHNPVMGRSNFGPYYAHQNNGWTGIRPPMVAPPLPQVTYVEDQQAKKVRNDVNVHKDTLRLEIDEENPDQHLVTFVFDALYDGRLPVELSCATESLMPLHSATASALLKSMLSSKEEPDCKFVPVFPESYMPVKVPFQKGPGQKFRQPSGTGVDLGFFELDDLSKPSPGDVFPLVISAETCLPSLPLDENHGDPPPKSSPHRQITQAIVEKKDGDLFKVRVIKQILWIDEVRYELREIYGIGNSAEAFSDNDSGKECVICMTESKDTAVLPCRHMCLCSECAKALRLQSNKCPICRQPIEALMEIKINNADQ